MPDCRGGDCALSEGREASAPGNFDHPSATPGTRNLGAARKFVDFATTAQSMAGVGRYISYSPTRRAAMPLISTHAEKGVEMNPHMPTSPQNAKRALRNDWEWWSDHADEMNERFSTWLAR